MWGRSVWAASRRSSAKRGCACKRAVASSRPAWRHTYCQVRDHEARKGVCARSLQRILGSTLGSPSHNSGLRFCHLSAAHEQMHSSPPQRISQQAVACCVRPCSSAMPLILDFSESDAVEFQLTLDPLLQVWISECGKPPLGRSQRLDPPLLCGCYVWCCEKSDVAAPVRACIVLVSAQCDLIRCKMHCVGVCATFAW